MIPSLMTILFDLFITPLELFFEVVFSIANRIVGNPGFAIIILSLAVNFLVLPLYKRADEVQKEERDLEASLQAGIDHIKKTFKGDERMMMLNTYYAQNNYSPLYVLKGSVSLLLQIPFFMAAYRFLSGLKLLRGVSFGPIHDLGAPDQMIVLAGIGINVLPIIMTLINFISGYLYTKGMPLKTKIQLYGMALIFLVLLYNSPSGLAFYWTLNNVFSMLKNIFYRFKRPGFVRACVAAFSGGFLMLYTNTFYDAPYHARQLRLTVFGAALIVPFIVVILKGRQPSYIAKLIKKVRYSKHNKALFVLSGMFLSVFLGLLIPSSVIKTSPAEFIDIVSYRSPNYYVINAMLLAAGVFLVWGGIFFSLARPHTRSIISLLYWCACPASAVTYLFFGTKLGNLSTDLIYDEAFTFTARQQITNALAIICVVAAAVLLAVVFKRASEVIAFALMAAALTMSIINMNKIETAFSGVSMGSTSDIASIPLTTEGQNVIVIMLDRAPGYLVPVIFDEIPELQQQFDGFTYYPNTLSFGSHTKFAAPALFGGYEYTPEAICSNTEQTLLEKHDEALSVLPVLFRDNGYEVTVCDPPFAGYTWTPDLSVFSGDLYEGINAYITKGRFVDINADFSAQQSALWERNFFCYSLFKTCPLFLQRSVYNQGNYNQADAGFSATVEDEEEFTTPQTVINPSESVGVSQVFMNAYTVLTNLDLITDVSDNEQNTFMYINNVTPHNTMMLQEPEYAPAQIVDNTAYDEEHADRFSGYVGGYDFQMNTSAAMAHYQCNAASYIQLGIYFDYLRQMGVWDNTRIIIVSDHGPTTDMFGGDTIVRDVNMESFNCLLMVKDFGATGFNICEDFMTNADVPYLATAGVIENPVNPFTGNPLTMDGKTDYPMLIYDSEDWNVGGADTIAGADAYAFSEGDWYAFNGTRIFNRDSWEFDGTR
ncbi:MAG: membrane protein insertase YidC [Clostridiales bacterium]|nr:membrane protein insertase YidC [Clostridiales bacterium]